MIQYFEIDKSKTEEFIASPMAPRLRSYHEIIWVQSGKASFQVDGDIFHVEANSFFIIPKDRYHQFLPKEAVGGKVIRFSEDELNEFPRVLFSKFNHISEVKISALENKEFELLFELFKLEWQQLPATAAVIIHILKALIYKLEKVKQSLLLHNPQYELDLFDQFQQLLDIHIRAHKSVEYYAQKLNITPRKLNETIKAVLNKTTIELIAERRLIEAKRVLLYTDNTITQTAYELGFEDNSYFTKFFKKHTRLTPKEFIHQQQHT